MPREELSTVAVAPLFTRGEDWGNECGEWPNGDDRNTNQNRIVIKNNHFGRRMHL